MKKFYKPAVTLLALSLFLVGCQQTAPSKRDTGMVIGGIAGALLGNQVGNGNGQVIATVAGTLAGVFIGGAIGENMDANDKRQSQNALESAPTHQQVSWRNPDSGSEYTVTPTRTYKEASLPCREYTTEAVIGGKREMVHGRACRQPDGTWQAAS
jgi:surface antigen